MANNIGIETIVTNLTAVTVGSLKLWFSYNTCVAFAFNGNRVVCQNVRGVTTGKHLNTIDGGDKASRVKPETFVRKTPVFGTPIDLLVVVEGGNVQAIRADADYPLTVTVRDFDNIEAGDPDPCEGMGEREVNEKWGYPIY